MPEKKVKKIAVTGTIGCGKSYVINHIEKSGVFVLNLDAVAKDVRDEMKDMIEATFQVENDQELAQIVFKDDIKRTKLEALLYPEIQNRMNAFFEQHQAEDILFVEVPLLFEKGWETMFDEIWTVYCDENTAIERLVKFRNMNKAEVQQRLASQMPLKEKMKRSHVCIDNNANANPEKQIDILLGGYHVKKR